MGRLLGWVGGQASLQAQEGALVEVVAEVRNYHRADYRADDVAPFAALSATGRLDDPPHHQRMEHVESIAVAAGSAQQRRFQHGRTGGGRDEDETGKRPVERCIPIVIMPGSMNRTVGRSKASAPTVAKPVSDAGMIHRRTTDAPPGPRSARARNGADRETIDPAGRECGRSGRDRGGGNDVAAEKERTDGQHSGRANHGDARAPPHQERPHEVELLLDRERPEVRQVGDPMRVIECDPPRAEVAPVPDVFVSEGDIVQAVREPQHRPDDEDGDQHAIVERQDAEGATHIKRARATGR